MEDNDDPKLGLYVDTVNAVRQSDLIDFSLGIVRNGVSPSNINGDWTKISLFIYQ